MKGRIIKGIAGFYYVDVPGQGVYECRARGVFRNRGQKPLVGDYAEIFVTDEENRKGNVTEILERKNDLIRPAVANVDQALLVFALTDPSPDRNLLDRLLVMMEYQGIKSVIVFNKADLADSSEQEKKAKELSEIYRKAGYEVLVTSVRKEEGVEAVKKILHGKSTTVAGPSGVGKSSLINALSPSAEMQTGDISEKIRRGRNTTRHAELIELDDSTCIFDTPGFSSMMIPGMEPEDLDDCFPEFVPKIPDCRFQGCAHKKEPGCVVKEAVDSGEIDRGRYENYCLLYDELKARKRY